MSKKKHKLEGKELQDRISELEVEVGLDSAGVFPVEEMEELTDKKEEEKIIGKGKLIRHEDTIEVVNGAIYSHGFWIEPGIYPIDGLPFDPTNNEPLVNEL